MRERVLTAQPRVTLSNFSLRKWPTWEDLDERASELLRREVLAVPSVRIAVLWTLEHLQLVRHRDEIMVPAFLGRCLLNTLGRRALPVQALSTKTRVALVVHQYGFVQDLAAIGEVVEKEKVGLLEDSPHGLDFVESCHDGAMGRAIALTKLLPIVKGGLFYSSRGDLLEFIRERRREPSSWSWIVLLGMASLRGRLRSPLHVGWADALYELYPMSTSDNGVLRGNFLEGLNRIEEYERIIAKRVSFACKRLGARAMVPTLTRLAAFIPFIGDGIEEAARDSLRRHGLDSGLYHIDQQRNMFDPSYKRIYLIPLNPTMPEELFRSAVSELGRA